MTHIYNLKFKDTCHGLQDLYSIACSRIHIWNTLDRTLPWRSFRLTHHRSIWPNKTEICVGNRYQLTQLNPGSVVQSQPRLHLKLQIEGASPESVSKLSRANPRVKIMKIIFQGQVVWCNLLNIHSVSWFGRSFSFSITPDKISNHLSKIAMLQRGYPPQN